MNMFSTHDHIQFVVLATVNNTTARLDLIGAHWDITLFLLCGGVQGANNTYICHLLYMWACTWYLQQGLKCFLFSLLQARGLDTGCFAQLQALQGAQ